MKQICLFNEPASHYTFSAGELALLREEFYELDDKGRVVVKPSYLQIQKNLKFAFEAFSKYHGSDFKLKIDDIWWHSFLQVVKLRNRLMHPKFATDLLLPKRSNRNTLILREQMMASNHQAAQQTVRPERGKRVSYGCFNTLCAARSTEALDVLNHDWPIG
jgi:hypothetical protein